MIKQEGLRKLSTEPNNKVEEEEVSTTMRRSLILMISSELSSVEGPSLKIKFTGGITGLDNSIIITTNNTETNKSKE